MDPKGSERKRKVPGEESFEGDLTLKLSVSSAPPAPLPLQHELPPQLPLPPQRTGRTRRSLPSSNSKYDTIAPPYPWATNRRATVHSLEYLRAKNIKKISGDVQCKKCNARCSYEFDLEVKFREVADFICRNKEIMRERAPKCWLSPDLPACNQCGQPNSLKPVTPESKESINWLFLLLGQMLGFCTLEQLKYFCQHTKNHRTGAKDRVLFLTFLGLCKQLDPRGPFDRF